MIATVIVTMMSRFLHKPYFISAGILLGLLFCVSIGAESLPVDSYSHLQEILQRPEFQPRTIQKSGWEQLMEQLWTFVGEQLLWVWQKVKQFFANSSIPMVPETAMAIFEFLERALNFVLNILGYLWRGVNWLVFLGCVGVLSWLGWKLAQKYAPALRASVTDTSEAMTISLGSAVPLTELLHERQYSEALALLRLRLRRDLQARLPFRESTTDRELIALSQQTVGNTDGQREQLFIATARLFERVVFNGATIDGTRVESLGELVSLIERYEAKGREAA